MQETYNYRKFSILFVDDEELSLKYFTFNLESVFHVLTAANATDGLMLLQKHGDQIGIIVTDQRMPGETGVEFLEKARKIQPRALRIMATAYADMDATIQAVNTGAIYKYITKPFDYANLELTLRRAMEFYIVQQERDHLLREKISAIHRMMLTDRLLSLGIMASGLGHHLRNSLTAVKAFLDLAPAKLAQENISLQHLQDPSYWNEFYKKAQDQLEGIVGFLHDIDGYVTPPASRFDDRLDIPTAVREAYAPQTAAFAANSIRLVLEESNGLPAIQANQKLFLQIFESLGREQIKLLPKGGEIRIGFKLSPANAIGGPRVTIDIHDNGPGFPENALFRLFDPFYIQPESPSDLGIGLLSVFFLVYHHGGTLSVHSQPGTGTQFTLNFPVQPVSSESGDKSDLSFLNRVFEVESAWERLLMN
ncbi:MAG: hybrid sensor histidine kinase/response regulator [Candidatus Methylacidiphilales bacterium]|nr:hybrid sensor histidine kinase/response regulator [Candidatus Methylacidiphilales bacterium]